MREKNKTNKSRWIYRQLFLAVFIALFFSLSMTWVELDPVMDHQKNVDLLRSNQAQTISSDVLTVTDENSPFVNQKRVRQTDGIVFGSSLLVVIIIGGVFVNIRNL